jgi:hypothetical protein
MATAIGAVAIIQSSFEYYEQMVQRTLISYKDRILAESLFNQQFHGGVFAAA